MISADILTKVCTKCHRELPATRGYFTPNKHGKYGLRPDCNECRRAEANTEKGRAYSRERYKNHPPKPESIARHQRAHRERYLDAHPKLKEAHELRQAGLKKCPDCKGVFPRTKEFFVGYYRDGKWFPSRCHACNTKMVAEWRRTHPEIRNAAMLQRYRRKAELPHTLTKDDWLYACAYFGYRCVVCRKEKPLVKDHWISIQDADCPGTIPTNIVPMCRACSSSKNDEDAYEWLCEKCGEGTATTIMKQVDEFFDKLRKKGLCPTEAAYVAQPSAERKKGT